MFTSASTCVHTYPTDIEIPSGPSTQTHHQRERVNDPTANGPEAVTSESPCVRRSRVPPPPLHSNRTGGNNGPTDSRRQQPDQRFHPQIDPSTMTDDHNNRLPYPHSAPRRRRRHFDRDGP